MVEIRGYKESDYEEVVQMYYNMCLEVYPHRQFKSIQYFHKNVQRWLDSNYDIIVTENNNSTTGFSLCYYDSMGGIVEDFYHVECVYVKPEYRNGRSAYLLMHSIMIFADNTDKIVSANASELTSCSKITSKLGIKLFTHYERLPIKESK